MPEVFCKYCDGISLHEFVKFEVSEGMPVIYLRCTKCKGVHMYGYVGTEFTDEN